MLLRIAISLHSVADAVDSDRQNGVSGNVEA